MLQTIERNPLHALHKPGDANAAIMRQAQLISNNACKCLISHTVYLLLSFIHCMVCVIPRSKNSVIMHYDLEMNGAKCAGIVGYKLDLLKNVMYNFKR